MCVANLNVSLQPCSHRWYTLVRPCSDSTNLSNCSKKVRLEGWESRVQDCPWCGPSSISTHDATHKLFGGNEFSEARRRSDSTVASTESIIRGRSNSISTFSAINSRSSSQESESERRESERAESNRMMNRRLDAYIITAVPDEIPSRKASIKRSTKPVLLKKESSDSSTFARRGSSMLGRWGSTKKKNRLSAVV